MIKKHMPMVTDMEYRAKGLTDLWADGDFTNYLRQKSTVGIVAQDGDEIIGYCVYEILCEDINRILNIVVDPWYAWSGVGTAMIHHIVERSKRHRVEATVHERLVTAQLFFKSLGMKWTKTLKKVDGDHYFMKGSVDCDG
jgi:ribosomal protein S18 acetylase RimI-like enzyme